MYAQASWKEMAARRASTFGSLSCTELRENKMKACEKRKVCIRY